METYPVVEGKTVIITGSAMGMGEATARLFARAKANVVLADYNAEKGQEVTDSIVADGGTATFVKTDISKSEDVQAMVAHAVSTYGRLDGAVNNAAMTPDQAMSADFDEDYWDKLIAVDLKGTALCMKYELRQFLAQGDGGAIVNVSSVSAFRPQPGNIAYVSAKHGIEGMTKVAALEYGAQNIRVNSLAPGAIDTPMLRGALEEAGLDPEAFAPQLSLLNRFGQPEEIAQGSLWLISDLSSYVTGTCLAIDAGYIRR